MSGPVGSGLGSTIPRPSSSSATSSRGGSGSGFAGDTFPGDSFGSGRRPSGDGWRVLGSTRPRLGPGSGGGSFDGSGADDGLMGLSRGYRSEGAGDDIRSRSYAAIMDSIRRKARPTARIIRHTRARHPG